MTSLVLSDKQFCIGIMISLSAPIYNEKGSIEELFEKVRKVMNRHGTPGKSSLSTTAASTEARRFWIAWRRCIPR